MKLFKKINILLALVFMMFVFIVPLNTSALEINYKKGELKSSGQKTTSSNNNLGINKTYIVPDLLAQNSLSLSRFSIYSMDSKYDYLSGESILLFLGLGLSQESGIMTNAKVVIKIAKEYVDSVIASDISSQTYKSVTNDDDFYYIEYGLLPLQGGGSIDLPLEIISNNGETPDNYKLIIEGKLLDFEGTELQSTSTAFSIHEDKPDSLVKTVLKKGYYSETDGNIISGGQEDDLKPGYLTSDLSRLQSVIFSFVLKNNFKDYGLRKYEKFVFEDSIPVEAVFIPEDNPGWIYDPLTRLARYELIVDDGYTITANRMFSNQVNLSLKFPGAKTHDFITNEASVKIHQKNMQSYETVSSYIDSIKIKLEPTPMPSTIGSAKNGSFTYQDTPMGRNREVEWNMSVSNNSISEDTPNLKLENVIIKDYDLDSRLNYKRIEFESMKLDAFVGSVDVVVTHKNGTVETISNDLTLTSKSNVILPSTTKSFEIRFTPGSYLLQDKYFRFKLLTELIDKDIPVIKDNATKVILKNSASFSGNYENGAVISNTRVASNNFIKTDARLSIDKSTESSTVFINDLVGYEIVGYATQYPEGLIVKDYKVIDILPKGMIYEPNTANITIHKDIKNTFKSYQHFDNSQRDPEIILNFNDTGHTALIWNFGDLEFDHEPLSTARTKLLNITYKAKVGEGVEKGINKNYVYGSWINNNHVRIGDNTSNYIGIEDLFDVDRDGLSQEYLAGDNVSVNYVPPKELIVRKEVMGSLDSTYLTSPNFGLSEIGATLKYKFTILNNSVTAFDTFYLLDLFPRLDDATTSLDITLTNPSRVPRLSDHSISLAGPIIAPHGYKIMYTSDSVDEDVTEFVNDSNWVETMGDYSKATAFMMVIEEGHELLQDSQEVFYADFIIPKDYSLETNDQVVNSYGVAVSDSLNFTESNLVTSKIVKYTVDGYVFDDFIEDGIFDKSSEVPFVNHKVELIDEHGNTVLDLEGKPYEVITGFDGYFKFDVYRNGNFKVRIVNPSGYQLTQMVDHEFGSNIISNTTHLSDVFKLDKYNLDHRVNAGFYKDSSILKIEKILKDADEKIWNTSKVFEFEIKLEGNMYNGFALIGNQRVSVINGILSIPANSTARINDLKKGSNFSVREINNQEYTVYPSSSNYKGVLDSTLKELVFTNVFKVEKTDITVEKVWNGGPSNKPNVEVQLYRDGVAIDKPVILANGQTSYTWTDLDKTDSQGKVYSYTVDEINVPEGYSKVVDGFVITNNYDMGEFTPFPNGENPLKDENVTVLNPDIQSPPLGIGSLPMTGVSNNVTSFGKYVAIFGLIVLIINKFLRENQKGNTKVPF